ncbi:single-stranded DNA-binding protein [Lysobacter daejeonensis GH1-9]|uniref:Single-stranded DNA-binding protein n=1 Tax=Lysobacter daejeonensis GH1-9 TaxID=1385517 RepID=A0A0A0F0F6_9GAMM|nr:single-stranded DNA-binding protein [Lysobacter daejeonensis]KGM56254.1 single-stranded DNA-binding protein [Lysobacter daejeonensis GH1-9]
MERDVIVEVVPGEVKTRGGNFKNDDGDDVAWTKRTQEARLQSNGFIYPYDVRLEEGQPPYPPGRYRLAIEKMLQVNKGAHFFSKFSVLEALLPGSKA